MPNGLYILAACFALLVLLAAWTVAEWQQWDHQRRSERLVHRNLNRMTGGRR